MLLLNYLLRGCISGLSDPLVSQMVGGGGPWPSGPPVPTPMGSKDCSHSKLGTSVEFIIAQSVVQQGGTS